MDGYGQVMIPFGCSSTSFNAFYPVDSQRYTALYTRDTTVNETLFKDLVNQAGDQGKDLVQLNTTCANSTTM